MPFVGCGCVTAPRQLMLVLLLPLQLFRLWTPLLSLPLIRVSLPPLVLPLPPAPVPLPLELELLPLLPLPSLQVLCSLGSFHWGGGAADGLGQTLVRTHGPAASLGVTLRGS